MLLLTNCGVHARKYLDRSFEVRTERSLVSTKNSGSNIPRMDRTNWSIRALLHSQYGFVSRSIQVLGGPYGFGRTSD